jgi:hypothetical protein
MDDIVKAALKKWPNVPACYGWLALDSRGNWFMRDDATQAQGPFPQVKGSRIEHTALREFIERNYGCDDKGCWYFQNGPQRVYVELEAAPWVWRLQNSNPSNGAPNATTHTGLSAPIESSWLDEHGRLFLMSPLGPGLVHTLDMEAAADAVERRHWVPIQTNFLMLTQRFGYWLSPKQAQEISKCDD